MAKPRLPKLKAEVSGAALHDPQRHKDRKAPKQRAIGEPYARMTEAQKIAWEEFKAELPWLTSGHRALLQIACIMRARMDTEDIGVNQIQTYSSILSKLGATPVDETKVTVAGEEDEDPSDAFFSRPH
jgi:hypothetical protein